MFSKVPVLNCTYDVLIKSSFDDKERNGTISIYQTYLDISLTLKTKEGFSESFSANLIYNEGRKKLIYSYQNNPKMLIQNSSPIHYGTAVLNLDDIDNIEGYYYTSRMTKGEIYFYSN